MPLGGERKRAGPGRRLARGIRAARKCREARAYLTRQSVGEAQRPRRKAKAEGRRPRPPSPYCTTRYLHMLLQPCVPSQVSPLADWMRPSPQ
jgi:hypothetical protein